MTVNKRTLVTLYCILGAGGLTGCGALPDDLAGQAPAAAPSAGDPSKDMSVEEESDVTQIEQAITGPSIPKKLKVDKISDVKGTCRMVDGLLTAEIKYSAKRGKKTDKVVLTFTTENAFFDLNYRRNGHDLGTQRIDGLGGQDVGSDRNPFPGRELETAYLLGELSSSGVMKKFRGVGECLKDGIGGQVTRNGQTFSFFGLCELAFDAIDALGAGVVAASTVGCCAGSAGVACPLCVGAAAATAVAIDKETSRLIGVFCN